MDSCLMTPFLKASESYMRISSTKFSSIHQFASNHGCWLNAANFQVKIFSHTREICKQGFFNHSFSRDSFKIRSSLSESNGFVQGSKGGVEFFIMNKDDAGPTVEEADSLAANSELRNQLVKKGRGAKMADCLFVLGGLLDRPFGSNGQMIAAAGNAVVEKVKFEANSLTEDDSVNSQTVFEILRIMQLLAMDLSLISNAQKQETLLERLEKAKEHCKQGIQLANSL